MERGICIPVFQSHKNIKSCIQYETPNSKSKTSENQELLRTSQKEKPKWLEETCWRSSISGSLGKKWLDIGEILGETEASGVPGRLLAARMSEMAAVATPLFPPPSSYWSERMMTNGLERKTPTRFESEACSRRKGEQFDPSCRNRLSNFLRESSPLRETGGSGVPGRLLAARMSEKAAVATPLFPLPSSYWSKQMMTKGTAVLHVQKMKEVAASGTDSE
ncbi:unnamed protein product [Caenorhabditis auriculariae]|uniref:Uncharacterized protein n=1 Tax=Caenorhabditis auriculariae TaxID=2777116 RepID=A0A8S1H1U5_9PELO|nr:unnamed protein product [Caenorhabditis auriculariae]